MCLGWATFFHRKKIVCLLFISVFFRIGYLSILNNVFILCYIISMNINPASYRNLEIITNVRVRCNTSMVLIIISACMFEYSIVYPSKGRAGTKN